MSSSSEEKEEKEREENLSILMTHQSPAQRAGKASRNYID